MKLIVTGGSGFIGHHLIAALVKKGHGVKVLDIRPSRHDVEFVRVDLAGEPLPPQVLADVDAVIHLAGRDIFGRWNNRVKRAIYDSRILSARSLVSSMARLDRKPAVLVSASAVGIYGDRGDEELYESSSPGNEFLAGVCIDWEAEARKAEALGLRTVQVRTAPVMGRGGILARVLPLYRRGLGGPLGSGSQWFPWIHIQDIVGIYVMAVENSRVSGPINACAPGRITNKQFSDALARVLHRPGFLRVPGWALRLVLDGMADVVLDSQKVISKKVTEAGYKFAFPEIQSALEDVLARR